MCYLGVYTVLNASNSDVEKIFILFFVFHGSLNFPLIRTISSYARLEDGRRVRLLEEK